MPVLFDGASVGGRVPVPGGADGGAQQRAQHGKTGRGHQEVRVRRQEAAVPVGQGAEGVHHVGHHNERVYRVLVAVLRARARQAVPQRPVQHTQLAEQPFPVAGLRQFVAESREYTLRVFVRSASLYARADLCGGGEGDVAIAPTLDFFFV